VIYGRGDHMLNHLSHTLYTFSIFGLVGIKEKPIRPLAVEDLVTVIVAAFLDARLSNKTVSITGPEEILLSEPCAAWARSLEGVHCMCRRRWRFRKSSPGLPSGS